MKSNKENPIEKYKRELRKQGFSSHEAKKKTILKILKNNFK